VSLSTRATKALMREFGFVPDRVDIRALLAKHRHRHLCGTDVQCFRYMQGVGNLTALELAHHYGMRVLSSQRHADVDAGLEAAALVCDDFGGLEGPMLAEKIRAMKGVKA
jgi:hypothetical protein